MNEVAENLFVGDRQDASHLGTSHKFDTVVTLIDHDFEATTVKIPILDSENNDQSAFNDAVDAVRAALADGHRVFVHCSVGASRSVTVAAAAIAANGDLSLREALNQVDQQRPQANPNPALVEQAYDYLGTTPPRPFGGSDEERGSTDEQEDF